MKITSKLILDGMENFTNLDDKNSLIMKRVIQTTT